MHGAAAVNGLCSLLTVVEQAAEFTVEAGPRHDELHSYWTTSTTIKMKSQNSAPDRWVFTIIALEAIQLLHFVFKIDIKRFNLIQFWRKKMLILFTEPLFLSFSFIQEKACNITYMTSTSCFCTPTTTYYLINSSQHKIFLKYNFSFNLTRIQKKDKIYYRKSAKVKTFIYTLKCFM